MDNPPIAPAYLGGEIVAERYEIDRLIGRGAGSEVYAARDRHTGNERVALKLFRHAGSVAQCSNAAREEFSLAKSLEHPNILAVRELGLGAAGEPMIVSELVEGPNLFRHLETLEGRALPLREAVPILTDIAAALAFAHARGVIHRDVKPENVFLGRAVKLGDFGTASFLKRERITRPGDLSGTPGYLAPEQLGGQALDHRADIYSFGVLAHEITTGERASIEQSELATIVNNSRRAKSLSDFPLWFRDLVLTSTEIDRRNRFRSMEEIREVLAFGAP